MNPPLIAPSLLAADFGNLEQAIRLVDQSEADWHHLDIMDGLFVPNISYGMPVVEAIGKYASKPLDIHLMIVDPDRYIETFAKLGATVLTVHYEACTHLHRTLQAIRAAGMQAGIALNPHSPVALLEDSLELADLVLIMSVNPGFGGQSFIENTYKKIRQCREMIDSRGLDTRIEVDGGVGTGNARQLVEAGAEILVAGSSVFKSKDPKEAIKSLKNG